MLDGAAVLAAPALLPEMTGGTAEIDTSFGTLHGLYWLCANLANRRPLVLLVDDVQWADEASLRFLGVLARRLDALRVLVVLAQRPGPPREVVALCSDPQAELLALRALSVAGTQALLAEWSPDGRAELEFSHACEGATGGNPFLLSRLAAGLREQGVDFTDANAGQLAFAGAEAVRETVGATLVRLDASAVALAEAVAVLQDDVELALAAELAGIDRSDMAADTLARVGVLEDARPLRFVHAIVRDAVAARLSAGVRETLHARAAELLVARHADHDAVAVHLMATRPRGRPWVVDQLVSSARRALEQGAPETAVVRLRRALDEPPLADQEAAIVLDLARAENKLGRRESIEHFRRARELASDRSLRARATIELAWASGPAVDATVVEQLTREIAEADGDRELALELEAARLLVVQILALPDGETSAARARRRWAQLDGGTVAERLLLAQLAIGQMAVGGPARSAADFAERAVGDSGFEAVADGELSMMLAIIVLYKADRLDVADRVLARELRAAQQRGSLSGYALVCNFSAAVALRRGDLAAAEADARDGLDALPTDAWQRTQLMSALLDTLTETGRAAEAEAMLDAGGWRDELPDNRATNPLLASRARVRQAQGDHRRALDDALEAHRRMDRGSSAVDTNWNGWARIALLHSTLGDVEAAREAADEFLRLARRWDTPAVIGQALCTSGLTEGGSRGLELLRDAGDQLERSPARLLLAEALVAYGAALRRRGDRARAREPLRRGLDIASASGARPLAERARQELNATGLRVRRDAQTGVGALTPSERRVADHAATGATNPEIAQALFVTVKTIEMHLGNVYRKLDITTRSQLPRKLQTRR